MLPEILADLERDTNVQVLMVQGSPEYAKELRKSIPDSRWSWRPARSWRPPSSRKS